MRTVEMRTRLLLVVLVLVALVVVPSACSAANLLTNPGWESGATNVWPGNPTPVTNDGWTYVKTDGDGYYFWRESELTGYSTGPLYHDGVQAMRAESNLLHNPVANEMLIYQDVAATPGASYAASAWIVATEDIAGWGFGGWSDDWAGVIVKELNASDVVVDTHQVGFTTPSSAYRQAAMTFGTTANTVKLRYEMRTLLHSHWSQGHVTYDDTSLAMVPEPSSLLAIASGGIGLLGLVRRRRA
ncbi:MAG: PEP-CTERM sorting domain-containing protein [Armatimonadetes bacterium]|nr:PEP-CTERM sorting domain-containing protein [Armatimonadota bacterium]